MAAMEWAWPSTAIDGNGRVAEKGDSGDEKAQGMEGLVSVEEGMGVLVGVDGEGGVAVDGGGGSDEDAFEISSPGGGGEKVVEKGGDGWRWRDLFWRRG